MVKHSRKSTFTCIFFIISALSGSHLSLVVSIIAVSDVPQSNLVCNNHCGNTPIMYPFYLKPCGNTVSEFELECYNNSTLMITLNKVSYTVTRIDPDAILIDPYPSSCAIDLKKFSIDGIRSFAISTSNLIELSNCTRLLNCSLECNIPSSRYKQCPFYDTCCIYLGDDTLWRPGHSDFAQFSQMRCTAFTSWTVTDTIPTYHANNGLRLEWAIPGNCTSVCDAYAGCVKAREVKGGVRCSCNDSYIGDGYAQGTGCRGVLPRFSNHSMKEGVKIGSITGGILGVLLILILMLMYYKRYSRKPDLSVKVPSHIKSRSFSIAELRTATHNFSQEIGKGGFGTVFYGKFPDGKEIAVKVLSSSSKQGELEFLNEIDLLSRVNHKNLVWLLGYCISSKELMLVYEYVGGRSLRDHLHGSLENTTTLNWKARIQIALDAAEGLEYLHSRSRPKIIHRDVKSSNILLDLNTRAKVADFGLSKILQDDGISHVTTTIKGTMGYLDPEYFSTNKLTERSDVHSFGVVMLEIICGRKPIEDAVCEEEINLVRWVMLHAELNEYTRCGLTNIIDRRLSLSESEMQCINCVVNLALQCVDRDGSRRPTMNEIVSRLRAALLCIEPIDINAEITVGTLSSEEYRTGDCSSSLLHVGR